MRKHLLLAGIMVGILAPLPAYALDCDSPVVDAAGLLAGRVSEVESAANNLVSQASAEVRIRTYGTPPGGNIDATKERLLDSCRSWQSADGGMKNNLVVLMVSTSPRGVGLYYGDQWRSDLDTRWPGIQAGMKPRFRDGDFAGGFVYALREINTLLVSVNAPPAPAGPVIVVPAAPAAPPVVVHEKPVDLSGLWTVLMWALGIGVLVALIFGIRSLLNSRERRRAAAQSALRAKAAAADAIRAWDDTFQGVLEAKVAAATAQVSDEDAAPLRASFETAKNLADAASEAFGQLEKTSTVRDLRDGDVSVSESESLKRDYEAIVEKMNKANAAAKNIDSVIKEVKAAIAAAPKRLDDARKAIDAARGRVEAVRSSGFKTPDADVGLDEAETTFAGAGASITSKMFGEALKQAASAATTASHAAEAAEVLPSRKRSIDTGLADLRDRIESVRKTIVAGREVFERVSSSYAESSWESVSGNGTEAENRVEAAVEATGAIAHTASMEEQEWSIAEETLREASSGLAEAESLMRSVHALEANLIAAKRDARHEIDAAAADIKKAWDFIHRHDDDVRESLEADLGNAEHVVEAARAELAKAQPDYLEVVKLAKEANASADNILAEARSEHEAMERLRAKAVSSVRDAVAAVSRAKEYIEDHSSDVESSARDSLQTAQRSLQTAERMTDLQAKVVGAEQAKSEADRAYSSAKSDVSDAENARRRAAEARRRAAAEAAEAVASAARAISYSSRSRSSSRSSYGGGFGGGGSSSWGSSSRGGGGSSSFGGSSRGGGGSSGW